MGVVVLRKSTVSQFTRRKAILQIKWLQTSNTFLPGKIFHFLLIFFAVQLLLMSAASLVSVSGRGIKSTSGDAVFAAGKLWWKGQFWSLFTLTQKQKKILEVGVWSKVVFGVERSGKSWTLCHCCSLLLSFQAFIVHQQLFLYRDFCLLRRAS